MNLVLVRIDDRLIHGQVVGGWLPVIQAERIVVASDRAAADSLQTGLMRLAVPDHVAVDVLPVARAAVALKDDLWTKERVLLLLPGVEELARSLVQRSSWSATAARATGSTSTATWSGTANRMRPV
jgi:PTS system mannose-specific IIB component